MKRIGLGLLLGFVWFLCNASSLRADEFLSLRLIPESKIVLRTEGRLEMFAPLAHDEAARFYGKLLEGEQDILVRDWATATYIEDNRNRPWHSITISKAPENGMTKIVIVKTTFGWLLSALTIRYAAVFVILFFLYLGMIISGTIISRTVKRADAAKKPA
jgi:hypothetical protein